MSRPPVAASLRLPYPPYLRRLARRGAGMWVLVRSAYAFLMAAMALFGLIPPAEGIALALHPGLPARAVLVALAALAVWWDRRRSRELLLPDNLAAWPGWFWAASLLAGLVLDVALQALLAAL